jgi:integrase/recombinase XerC
MAGMGLLAEYSAALVRRNYAEGTRYRRMWVVRCWLEHSGAGWPNATWRDIEAFGDTRDVGPSTWRDDVSHLSHFYRWAMKLEYCSGDPTVLVDRPRVAVRKPRPASEMQYQRLLVGATQMMTITVELMAWCGLRCREVATLDWRNIDLVDQVALVHGKGNRDRTVGLPRRVVQLLASIDAGDGNVVTSPTGRPMSPARVSQWFTEWAKERRVPITAHQLRHRYATMLLKHAGDITIVQYAMGHASVATTEIYALIDRERAIAVARLLDGANDLRLF